MEERSRDRKRENDPTHDGRGRMNKKTLPLYFFPPLSDGRFRVVNDGSKYKVTKRTDLRKENRLQDEKHTSLPSSLRKHCKEELFHITRQDKERLNGKRNFVKATGVKRPLFLPPLTTKTFPRLNCKQVDGFATPVKSRDCLNAFPEDLPKIKTRKSSESKDVNSVSARIKNTEETAGNQNLPLLTKRTVKPARAAISSSATLRGLITLDLEEQFVLRFRLSNYDAKDVNIATLNGPV